MFDVKKQLIDGQQFLNRGKYIIDWDKKVIIVNASKKSILKR